MTRSGVDVTVVQGVSHKRTEKNSLETFGKFTVLEIWK